MAPLIFWWKINSTSREEFQTEARFILSNAEYLLESLKKAGIKVWKNPYSNTVFFERPPDDVVKKYDLALDESQVFGKVAHIVVMPHIDQKLIDGFVQDMKRWKSSG